MRATEEPRSHARSSCALGSGSLARGQKSCHGITAFPSSATNSRDATFRGLSRPQRIDVQAVAGLAPVPSLLALGSLARLAPSPTLFTVTASSSLLFH